MAAGLGFKTFATGEVLSAANVNGYLMQGILVFATEAARDAAITVPAEGQFAFTKDTNSTWFYDGAAWVVSGGGISPSIVDAKGDLIAATAADTVSRLAVGANDTVLTADSTAATGMKWAAVSTAPTFVGCRAYAFNDQNIPNSTNVTVGFNSEVFDTNNFHDNSTNNSRMTVPSGYAGKYRLDANLFYGGNTSSNRVMQVRKNGNIIATYSGGAGTSAPITIFGNLLVDAAVGDYFQIITNQDSGSTLTIFGSNSLNPNQGATSFNFQYLGA